MSTPPSFITANEAVNALKNGELVALPTETVYGLAAPIDNPQALEHIFKLKERPLYDPLIVHISDLGMLHQVAQTQNSPALVTLAEHFWPGPLTLVFPKNPQAVSDLITSGQDTVAVRMPRHSAALEVIARLGTPLAAPSANPFKKTSPTSATLVQQYFPDLKVLDGGECQVGIESTIVRQIDPHTVEILRPGMITAEDMRGIPHWNFEITTNFNAQGPGSMKEHYQPQKPLFLIRGSGDLPPHLRLQALQKNLEISFLQKYKLNERLHKLNIHEIALHNDPLLAARYIYRQLLEEGEQADILYIYWDQTQKNTEAWQSILNRLEKAAVKTILAEQPN